MASNGNGTHTPLTPDFITPAMRQVADSKPEPAAPALTTQIAALAMPRTPQLVLEEAARAAAALRDVIEKKPKKWVINGETYLEFEDWQTLGRFYGVTAAARSSTYIEYGRVRGFEAHAQALLVSTDRSTGAQVISDAEAMCLDDEPKWSKRPKYEWHNGARVNVGMEPVPLFQLRSMAQTRACAKVLRNVLAWVVVLAGYRPTPAEELDEPARGGGQAPAPAQSQRSGTIVPERITDFCTRMQGANNPGQLEEIFRAAYSEASKLGDQAAQQSYIQTREGRMREFRAQRPK